jgi:hypothetical protein
VVALDSVLPFSCFLSRSVIPATISSHFGGTEEANMRKTLLLASIVVVTISTGVSMKLSLQNPKVAVDSEPRKVSATLTTAEEHDLQKFLPQTLAWVAMRRQPTNCLLNGQIVDYNFAALYKQYESQEIEISLDVGENTLVAYSDLLLIYIRFKRLREFGLAPRDHQTYCGTSYAALKIWPADSGTGQTSPIVEQARRSQANPKAIEALESNIKEHPVTPENTIRRQETRRVLLRPLDQDSGDDEDPGSEQKNRLYQKILSVIREQAVLGCAPGAVVTATIPDFKIGDPSIYVLINGPGYFVDPYIEWLDFDREASTGEYIAGHRKDLALPEEVAPFRSLIKSKQIGQIKINCPANTAK